MSDRKYYIRKGNKAIGPLTRTRIEELREQGILTKDSILAISASGPWLTFEEVLLANLENSEDFQSQAMQSPLAPDSKVTGITSNSPVPADDFRTLPPEMIQKPVGQSKKVLAPENQLTTAVSGGANSESKLGPIFLFGILVVLLFQAIQSQKASDDVEPTKWEYTLESPSDVILQSSLDRLGNNGWEMIFARRASSEHGSPSYEMIFKRPKE